MLADKDKGAFGPKTLRILDSAYKEARRRLQRAPSEARVATEDQEDLARRIVKLAKSGERNITRLVNGALFTRRDRG